MIDERFNGRSGMINFVLKKSQNFACNKLSSSLGLMAVRLSLTQH